MQRQSMSKNVKYGLIGGAAVIIVIIILAALGSGNSEGRAIIGGGNSEGGAIMGGGNSEGGGISGGGNSSSGSMGLEEALASGAAVQYQRVICYDQALGCEAERTVAPEGWTTGGGVYWIMQCGAAPATIDFYIISPENNARAGHVGSMSFVEPDPIYQKREGDWFSPSLSPVKAYQNAETYAKNYFVEYTGMTDVQVVDVRYPEGEGAKGIQDYLSYLKQSTDALLAQSSEMLAAQNASMSFEHNASAAEIIVRFDLNGTPYKAKVFVVIFSTEFINSQDIQYVGQATERQLTWNTAPLGFNYYLAEESRFDEYEAAGDMFFSNRIYNEQWSSAVRQASDDLFKQQLEWTYEKIMEQQKALQQLGAQYVAQSAQNYSYSSSSSGGSSSGGSSSGYDTNVMGGWTNVVTDQSYYEGPDGGHVLLNYNDYHYTDGSSIYSSSQPLDTGGTGLSQLTELGPMGGD